MEILPVKTNTKDEFKISCPILPSKSFLGVVYGGVRSGKTNLLINLVYRIYNNKVFPQIYMFSPNIYNDDIFETNMAIDDNIIKFDSDFKNIDKYVEAITETQKEVDKDERKPILIIFDDILGFIKDRGFINDFASRYRQLKISMIFTTQAFRKIPNVIRSNASWMILFKCYNNKEKEKIIEELNQFPDFEEMFDIATDEKYSFLYADLKNRKLYKCFKECIYDHDDQYKIKPNK